MFQGHASQSIRALCLPPARIRLSTVDASVADRVGSVDTSILRFIGTPSILGTAISVATTVENGSIFTIRQRGLYCATLIAAIDDNSSVTSVGVSKNTNAAGLTAVPVLGTAGMLEAVSMFPGSAGVTIAKLEICFEVTAAEAAAGALVRFHATGEGPTSPPAAIQPTTILVTVTRIDDWLQ